MNFPVHFSRSRQAQSGLLIFKLRWNNCESRETKCLLSLPRVIRFVQLTSRRSQLHTRADQIFGRSTPPTQPLGKIVNAFNRVNVCTVSDNQDFIPQSNVIEFCIACPRTGSHTFYRHMHTVTLLPKEVNKQRVNVYKFI
jgi:hypothetical protein